MYKRQVASGTRSRNAATGAANRAVLFTGSPGGHYSWELLRSPVEGVVGVGEGQFGGVEDGLDLVLLVADAPQGAAFALHRPARDEVLGDLPESEEAFEFGGDGLVLAVEDFDVGQVE